MCKPDPSAWVRRGYLPAAEVARRLGRHTATVYRWIYAGAVVAEREGKYWYVHVESLLGNLESEYTPAAYKAALVALTT